MEKWYEVDPGGQHGTQSPHVGYLTYDDRFFYAGFEFENPALDAIRAPYADRDNIGNGYNDYGGIIIGPRNTGRTATFFVVTPRNIQYDAITDDASGEDSSPDFFWESATKFTAHGWTIEMRIPFSSLRYKNADPQTWGILLYRNFPRDRHYQFFSAKLPRGGNCFICRSNTLVGMEKLLSGGHLVAAPYVSASADAHPRDDLGSPLVADPVKPHVGLDVKFAPNADNAIDLTVKPDFSQVESDTALISANERFALFFPEKRPFFREGVDLFQTPIQAVYTRTITSPVWGGRVTGKEGGVRYTVLVADDAGGGSAILPGRTGRRLRPWTSGPMCSSRAPSATWGCRLLACSRRIAKRSPATVITGWRVRTFSGGRRGPTPSRASCSTARSAPNRPDLADAWTGHHADCRIMPMTATS